MDKRAGIQKMPHLISAMLFFLWSAFGCSYVLADSSTDYWTVSRGDPSSQGVSHSKIAKQPTLLWEHSISTTAFETTPILVAGRVYLGDLDGEFYALDFMTGKELWKSQSDSGFVAAAAYRDGRLVIGDYDGLVRCLQADDGTEVWRFETQAQIDGGANFYKDLVLVTSEDGSLYALNLTDGQLKWQYETGDQLRCAPTVAGNRTFLAGCDGKLHVVDLDLGQSIGEGLPLEGPTGSTPAAQGDIAIAPTHGGAIFAFNWKEAKQLWMFSDSERSQEIRSSPAIDGSRVFVATRNRRLLALDKTNGNLSWEFIMHKRSDASPIVCDGRVWIGASDGRIYAIDQNTGLEVWLAEHPGAFNASAAIAEGKLVIASDKGSIYCYGTATKN